MSQNNKNMNKSIQKVVVKPFCKVCFDTGKSEAEYTSHFVKSEPGVKGKVVCPTLLSQACTYCREPGHTVSHCLKLKQNNKNKEHAVRVQEYAAKQTTITDSSNNPTVAKRVGNGFAALAKLDVQADELDRIQVDQQKAYPALSDTPPAALQQMSTKKTQVSYANMAAKTTPARSDAVVMAGLNKLAAKAKSKAVAKQSTPVTKKSWADWTDSDDDDDDEEEVSDCECGHCDF
jgi:hypothetical protein